MKNKMGRPRIGTQRAKGKVFSARFTPVEARQIDLAIARSHLSKSAFIRKTLLLSAEAAMVSV
jgi:hypothetical protein